MGRVGVKLSVVIPVHNGGEDFRQCLDALMISKRQPDEIIVVDDASTDSSGTLACGVGAQILLLDGNPHGPAVARNRGAMVAQGNVLVFIDADVAVHEDTLSLIEETLVTNPEISALFGSYD